MYSYFKRFSDFLFSLIAILLLSPVLIIITILLKFSKEKDAFYLQKRIGFKNKPFNILKFATMLRDSPNIGTGAITLRNDPRVTKIGKFLRMSKINELPQLFNILLGDMSIVGPRPLMGTSFIRYTEEVKNKIYNVKPGLTGIGSLIFRDEEKLVSESGIPPEEFYTKYIFPYKGQLESWYLENISFFTDIKIIFLTAWSIIAPHNNLSKVFFRNLPSRKF